MSVLNIGVGNLRRNSTWTILTILSTAFSIVRDYVSRFPCLAITRFGFAYLHAIPRREPEACRELERFAADNFAGIPSDTNWIVALHTLCEVCILLRDERRAEILYESLHPFRGLNFTMGCADVVYGSLESFLKQLTILMRRFNEAEGHFERVLKFNQQMSAPPLEAKTLYGCASILRLRGVSSEQERALAFLHRELDTAAALKTKELQRCVQPLLATVLTPRPTTSIAEHSGDTTASTTRRAIASMLFTDVVGSTQHVTEVKDRTWAELLGVFTRRNGD